MELSDLGSKATLTRTKTSGPDKRVNEVWIFVLRQAGPRLALDWLQNLEKP